MTSPTLSQAELREAVARLVDPKAWRDWDSCGAFPLRTDDSLAKADAILRLVSSTKGGGDQENLCGSGAEERPSQAFGDVSATPSGWVLVPVEPTMDQLAAGYEAMFDGKWDCSQAPMMGAGYDAMIAAAPPLAEPPDTR